MEENDDKVYYCRDCLSLAVIGTELGIDCCQECGSTDIGETDFDSWEKMYNNRYGRNFLNIKKNGRENED